MDNLKASTQNFDSNYIYKVEEREESEKIIHQSTKGGVFVIENIALPKLTRYFLKNNKGEPQGYIEKKFIQNFKVETSDDEEEFLLQNTKCEKIRLEPATHKENQNLKIDSHIALKSGKKSGNYSLNARRFFRSRERCQTKKINDITGCVPLGSSVFDHSKNYTLDSTSSNSTPSEKTFDIKHTGSTADTMTESKNEHPNKRLKNLFTIVKPNESFNEIRECGEVDLLNKTKELLMKLIDKELHRIQLNDTATKNVKLQLSNANDLSKKLKTDCIRKIEDELRLMKRLASY